MTYFLYPSPQFSLFQNEGLDKCAPFPRVKFQPKLNCGLCFYLFALLVIDKLDILSLLQRTEPGCKYPASLHALALTN